MISTLPSHVAAPGLARTVPEWVTLLDPLFELGGVLLLAGATCVIVRLLRSPSTGRQRAQPVFGSDRS